MSVGRNLDPNLISDMVSFKLTSTDPQFAKRVLQARVYDRVIEKGEECVISVSPTSIESENLRVHPMMANTYHYKDLLCRADVFLKNSLDDATMREIVMYYQIYLEPVIITTIEHFLWTCPLETLRGIAQVAGFPTGQELLRLQIEQAFTRSVTKPAVIKAILTASDIVNALPLYEEALFLLRNRSSKGNREWYTQFLR